MQTGPRSTVPLGDIDIDVLSARAVTCDVRAGALSYITVSVPVATTRRSTAGSRCSRGWRGRQRTSTGCARLSLVTVVLTLAIYVMVILACLKLSDTDNHPDSFRASRPLLYLGILGNFMLLIYVVVDDPFSLVWCAGLLAVGGVLYAAEYFFGKPKSSRSSSDELKEI